MFRRLTSRNADADLGRRKGRTGLAVDAPLPDREGDAARGSGERRRDAEAALLWSRRALARPAPDTLRRLRHANAARRLDGDLALAPPRAARAAHRPVDRERDGLLRRPDGPRRRRHGRTGARIETEVGELRHEAVRLAVDPVERLLERHACDEH